LRFSAAHLSFLLTPWHILLAVFCGLINQPQQQILEFQNVRIEALLNKLGRTRLLQCTHCNTLIERWFRIGNSSVSNT